MNGSGPAVSGRTATVESGTLRRLYEAVEKERVRQGLSMYALDGGSWNIALRHAERMLIRTFVRVLDELDVEIILINKNGDQL